MICFSLVKLLLQPYAQLQQSGASAPMRPDQQITKTSPPRASPAALRQDTAASNAAHAAVNFELASNS
jgi:hypothetical protein